MFLKLANIWMLYMSWPMICMGLGIQTKEQKIMPRCIEEHGIKRIWMWMQRKSFNIWNHYIIWFYSYSTKKIFRTSKFIELGASREKIIVGIPTYGRSYTIDTGSSKNPPGVVFIGAGKRGALTKEAGMLGYQEICLHVKKDNWTMVRNMKYEKSSY